MFGKTVLGIDGEHFEQALDDAKHAKGRPATSVWTRPICGPGRDVQGGRGQARRP
jgi:hypothetical protein